MLLPDENRSTHNNSVLADGAATGSYEIFHQAGSEGSGLLIAMRGTRRSTLIAGQVGFGIDGEVQPTAPDLGVMERIAISHGLTVAPPAS